MPDREPGRSGAGDRAARIPIGTMDRPPKQED